MSDSPPLRGRDRSAVPQGSHTGTAKSQTPRQPSPATVSAGASADYYRTIFNSTNDAVVIHDARTGEILDVNRAAEQLYRTSREELLHADVAQFSSGEPPCTQADAERWMARALSGEPQVFEWHCRRTTGELFWAEVSVRAARLGDEDRLIVVVRDIDERKRAERAQQENEQRLRVLFEQAADAIYVSELTGRLTQVNRQACRASGYTREELLARNVVEVDASVPTPEALEQVVAGIEPGRPVTRESRHRRKDGTVYPVEITLARLDTPAGPRILGIARDITARKEAEAKVRQSEQRYRGLVETSPDAVVLTDLQGRVVFANAGFASLHGLEEPQAWYGRSALELIAPEDRAKAREVFRQITETGRIGNVEFTFLGPGGARFPAEVNGSLLGGPDSESEGLLVVARDITERRDAEEALRERERFLRNVFEAIQDGISILDRDLNVVRTNRWMEKMYAHAGSLAGRKCYEVFQQRGEPCPWCPSLEAIRTGQPRTAEVAYPDADNPAGWIDLSAFPLRDEDGEVTAVIEYVKDITPRKLAEEALRANVAKMRSIFGAAPVGIGLVANRVLLEVNERLCEITGYDANELIGQSARMLYPSDEDYEYVGTEKYRQISERGTGTVETRFRRKDGAIIDVRLSSTPIDPDNLLAGVSFTVLDVTAAKRAEAERQKAQAQLEAAIAQSPSGVLIADAPDVTIRLANPAALGIRGGEAGSLTGIEVREHAEKWQTFRLDGSPYPPEDLPLSRAVLRGEVTLGEEVIIRDADGEDHWVSVNAAPIRDAAGEVTAGIVIFHDVTDRKRAEDEREHLEAQLRQAQKMEAIGRLAGGVAHDFNNMLSVILGNAELALEDGDLAGELRESLEEIRAAGKRSANLTRQLLAFARRQTVAPRVLDLNETVAGMLTMLRRLMGEDIDLSWAPAEDLPPVRMDPSQLDQLLANLCVNARDAIDGVGQVTIETAPARFDEAYCADHAEFEPGNYVMLAVSDSGCGMDDETLANIFEPFFTTKPPGRSTGLGLATVYGIVRQNGGFVNVYSEPGEGTSFRLYLPAHGEPDEEVARAASSAPPARGAEIILFVEDEPAILNVGRVMLQRLGYTVLTAATPGEALEVARKHAGEIHLLLTDVVMPEMNGRELARRLLSLYPEVKRVFMSGYTANVIAHRGVLDEGVHFIQKPFARADLAVAVRAALDEG